MALTKFTSCLAALAIFLNQGCDLLRATSAPCLFKLCFHAHKLPIPRPKLSRWGSAAAYDPSEALELPSSLAKQTMRQVEKQERQSRFFSPGKYVSLQGTSRAQSKNSSLVTERIQIPTRMVFSFPGVEPLSCLGPDRDFSRERPRTDC